MYRRDFLKHTGAIGAAVALSHLGMLAARAQSVGDYKALVCVFLEGGNDANNMVVPIGSSSYAAYAAARTVIALPQNSLLPLIDAAGTADFGLHPALGGANGLQAMWEAKQLAILTNVGTLVRPLTKAEFLQPDTPKPESLFSHLDQQLQWQASLSSAPSTTGWGARLADQLANLNTSARIPAMISTAGNSLFVTGKASQALTVPIGQSFALNGIDTHATGIARLNALKELLAVDRGTDLLDAAQEVMTSALASSALLDPILAANNAALNAYFDGQSSDIASQLLAVAKIIEARASLGARRQVFLVSMGSFDTHADQLTKQAQLLAELGPALKAFHGAMAGIGAGTSVTSFTLSDFSRTYQPNTSNGSDHAWGSIHFVAGDAVKGGRFYGTWPTLALGSADDAGAGRWIPTTAVDQYAATLSGWFGVDANALALVLPNLASFTPATLGFI